MTYNYKSAIISLWKVIKMIHRLSKSIADFLLKKDVVSESEIDIYVYGYEMIILSFIDLCIVVSIGLIFEELFAMLTFFAVFVSVRIYTGGYHANTVLRCKSVFTMISLSIIFLLKLKYPLLLYILILSLFMITCIYLAPVENSNKPLDKSEQMKYRKISISLSIVWSAVALLLYFFAIKICTAITVSAFYIMLLMVIASYGKEIKAYDEE